MENDNPALLNDPDADPNVYTVTHGMTTKQLERTGSKEEENGES